MKTIKLINLFILALFCQVVFSQNNDIVRSFDWRMDKSVEHGLDSTNIAKALRVQFEIPENYEFKHQVIKGTKDRMSEKDDLGYVHERYAQYYKGIKIEHSDIRVRYLNGLFASANGEYIDVPNIDPFWRKFSDSVTCARFKKSYHCSVYQEKSKKIQ